ncbi:MAG: tyrosine-type recombinase/integrase, partial [Streptosporangiaceae bacterium]
PGRQPHRKRPHPLIPPISCLATRTSTSHEHDTHGETPRHQQERTDKATSCNRSRSPGKGLRRTETSKLDVADWGRNASAPEFGKYGMLHVRYGKAKRGQPPRRRNVASVMGWAVDAVADYAENVRPRFGFGDHPALWVTERGGRVKPAEINSRFESYREALRLPAALSPHSLRHSYVTHLTEDGVDRRFIQVQVGHECDSSTAIYTHVSDDFMSTALRKALAPAFEEPGRRKEQR